MKKKTIILITLITATLALLGYLFYRTPKLPTGTIIDYIVVYKSKRQLLVYANGKLIKTYKISLGKNPIGAKEFEGDNKTPEGIYTINAKNPNSGYHKNLGISYPNAQNLDYAKKIGKPAGNHIKIHGIKNNLGFIGKLQRYTDWTAGCIAVTNNEIDELYQAVPIGTTIQIKP